MNRFIALGVLSLFLLGARAGATSLPVVGSGTLKAHLDASSGVTVDGGNGVSQWDDQGPSGANDFGQGIATQRPILIPGALNGKPVIDFDDVDDRLIISGGHNLTDAASTLDDAFTFFVVVRDTTLVDSLFDSSPSNGNVFRFEDSNFGASNHVELWSADPRTAVNGLTSAGSVIAVRGTASGSSRFIEASVYNSFGGLTTTTNSSANTSLISWTNPVIGTINNGNNGFFNGQIAEIAIYEGSLSVADRNAVIGALAASYAIPEPASATLLLWGACAAGLVRRQRRRE